MTGGWLASWQRLVFFDVDKGDERTHGGLCADNPVRDDDSDWSIFPGEERTFEEQHEKKRLCDVSNFFLKIMSRISLPVDTRKIARLSLISVMMPDAMIERRRRPSLPGGKTYCKTSHHRREARSHQFPPAVMAVTIENRRNTEDLSLRRSSSTAKQDIMRFCSHISLHIASSSSPSSLRRLTRRWGRN